MSNYIPLEYDRSHLFQSKRYVQSGTTLDIYDIGLLGINGLGLLVILIYYLSI